MLDGVAQGGTTRRADAVPRTSVAERDAGRPSSDIGLRTETEISGARFHRAGHVINVPHVQKTTVISAPVLTELQYLKRIEPHIGATAERLGYPGPCPDAYPAGGLFPRQYDSIILHIDSFEVRAKDERE